MLMQSSASPQLQHSPTGNFPNLILLLRFADHVDRALPSRDDISSLFNSETFRFDDARPIVPRRGRGTVAPTGSVRQVYFENSHSTFTVETTVVDWITLPRTEAYYASGEYGLSKSKFEEAMLEGLNALDSDSRENGGFDWSAFDLDENGALDGFGVMHSGYGAEFPGDDCTGTADKNRIWSHKGGFEWHSHDGSVHAKRYYVSSALRGKCGAGIVRMGVLVHELGHYLGLPDLYDNSFKGKGLGSWDFMSNSWGWDGSGRFPGNLSAWSKLRLGWATADVIEEDGTYELEAATSTGIRIYKIGHNFPDGEYLLLENRQPVAYDTKIKQGGIAIYHVDETARGQRHRGFPSQPGWPENGNHYKVGVLAASGRYDLEENAKSADELDLWHAGSTLKELGPGPDVFPNTDYYEKKLGKVGQTGIRIFGFSENGMVMTFSVEGITNVEVEGGMDAPTASPAPTTAKDPVHPTVQSTVSLARS